MWWPLGSKDHLGYVPVYEVQDAFCLCGEMMATKIVPCKTCGKPKIVGQPCSACGAGKEKQKPADVGSVRG